MLTTILIIITVIYLIELLYLLTGIFKADRVPQNEKYEPTVSVIVAARNEEHFIGDCLNSLIELDYPPDKLEIVIVNDGSTDKTPEIIRSYLKNHSSLKLISTLQRDGNLRGKANAIDQGIEATSGEIIMFTDADCRVPPSWIRATVKYFDPQTGIVGGFTLLDAKRSFEGMQALDWIFLFGLASATTGLNIPLTVVGNNLSIRRIAYEETGGFQTIPFSVTEDYALVQAILQKTSYQVRFPVDPKTVVNSIACQSWNQLYRQKQRWGVGGLDMIPRGLVIMGIGWITKLSLLLTLFVISIHGWLAAFLLMICGELIFLVRPLKILKALGYLRYFPQFILFFFVYVLILPVIAYTSKKVIWKERHLK